MKDVREYKEQQDIKSDGGKSSPYNEKEVEAAITIVFQIRNYYKKRIVIITPYKRQKFLLIKGFRKSGLENVWINTIDAFQGDEEDIVIYCTTRAVKETRYFSDSARLNVAFSRARNTLIFLGSSIYLKKYPKEHILHQVSDYLEAKATIIPYSEWLSPGLDLCYDVSYDDVSESFSYVNNILNIDQISMDFFASVNSHKEVQTACLACGEVLKMRKVFYVKNVLGNLRYINVNAVDEN